MKKHRRINQGFTLVEIMIVVAIIGLLAAIAIPNFVKARNNSLANACIDNLRQVDSAVQQWALEFGKRDSEAADPAQVAEYIRSQEIPDCPTGVKYTWAVNVSTIPSINCPVGSTVSPAHQLP